jgi:hypothetical protein
MARERKVTYRAQFDGHRRLAAAVILQAIKDASAAHTPQDRETAAEFLNGDMWPFSDVLDLPDGGRRLEAYVRRAQQVGAGSPQRAVKPGARVR